jgi:ABC-2 type transport system ATP-binding protein
MSQTADHVIVLGRGKVLADAPLSDLVRQWTTARVHVRSPRAAELADAVAGRDVEVVSSDQFTLDVTGLPASRIGDIAAERGIAVHELTPTSGSLEDAYLALTGDAVEYRTRAVPQTDAALEGALA